jgi:short-subunit dehydrogenase
LKGKVCIITGAGSGIGRSASIKLARSGATIFLVGRTTSKLEQVRQEIQSQDGSAVTTPCDVADVHAVRSLVGDVLKSHGRIDVLVNNAGYSTRNRTTLSVTPEEADEIVRVNLTGPIFFTQAVLPTMLKQKSGTIVNVSSGAALTPSRLSGPVYSAAKAGLVNFTRYLNIELQNSGVRACCIIPGEVNTPIMEKRPVPPSQEARATMLSADDVADAIVLAVTAHDRALVEEVVIRPRAQRDVTCELQKPY